MAFPKVRRNCLAGRLIHTRNVNRRHSRAGAFQKHPAKKVLDKPDQMY
jgi:hypothetical protein